MDEARGPEDRIEHIVREAESGSQFEFNPAAWSAMEAKLDAAVKVPFNWWKLFFPITGTAVLLIVLLWPIAAIDVNRLEGLSENDVAKELSADELKETNSNTPSDATTAGEGKEDETKTRQRLKRINGDTAQRDSSFSDVEVPNAKVAANNGSTEGIKARSGKISSSDKGNDTAKTSASSLRNLSAGVSGSQESNDELSEKGQVAEERLSTIAEKDAGIENVNKDQATVSYFSLAETNNKEELEREIEELSLRYQSGDLMFPEPDLEFQVDSALYSEKSSGVQYFNKSRWAFSAMVSADLSATGFEGFTDPGTMVGFGVEYFVNDKWSIQTGATYAIKRYTALGSEYETPDWISARPDDLLSASAVCRVIDIPLNIRRYFQNKKGNTFFVSTGVSTYLMLREDYNYEYTEERPGWLPFWSINNQNNHFLGILNLSVGYEKPLSKNLALGIEPFMKLPLTGIGAGRVRFLSFGTNIAIKLRK